MPLHLFHRQEIQASPERVFAVMTDLAAAKQWMPNLVAIEPLSEGQFAVGTRWRETRKMFGRPATEVFEVTELEPNRSLALFVDGKLGSSRRGHYHFRYAVEPRENGGTAVTVHGEIGGASRVLELIGRLFLGQFTRAVARDMTAMKEFIEAKDRM